MVAVGGVSGFELQRDRSRSSRTRPAARPGRALRSPRSGPRRGAESARPVGLVLVAAAGDLHADIVSDAEDEREEDRGHQCELDQGCSAVASRTRGSASLTGSFVRGPDPAQAFQWLVGSGGRERGGDERTRSLRRWARATAISPSATSSMAWRVRCAVRDRCHPVEGLRLIPQYRQIGDARPPPVALTTNDSVCASWTSTCTPAGPPEQRGLAAHHVGAVDIFALEP